MFGWPLVNCTRVNPGLEPTRPVPCGGRLQLRVGRRVLDQCCVTGVRQQAAWS